QLQPLIRRQVEGPLRPARRLRDRRRRRPDQLLLQLGQRRQMRRLLLACLAVLLIGVLLGRSLAPSPGGRAATPASPGAGRPPAQRAKASLAHSPAGAAIAVATYQREFATPAILRPGLPREPIESLAHP